MSYIGIGVLIDSMTGGSCALVSDYYGRKINNAVLDKQDNEVRLTFDDGVTIRIWDNGQSCCERRYIICDDNLSDLNGKTLADISVLEVEERRMGYGEYHDTSFLEIKATDGTSISFATHNEHNGYYGGFSLRVQEVGK